jgi:PAT family beta-lactamase induction signal transducer AmpG
MKHRPSSIIRMGTPLKNMEFVKMNQTATAPWYKMMFTPDMGVCFILGFSSGLPLFMFALLSIWMEEAGTSLKTLGLMSTMTYPYVIKFLWSPLVDRYAIRFLGRRRTWILLTQVLCFLLIASFAYFSPLVPTAPFGYNLLGFNLTQLNVIFLLGLSLGIASATQDIAIDAYRRERLTPSTLGLGTSFHINAYRLAGLVPGTLALLLTDVMSWPSIFILMAAFMLPPMILTLCMKEPNVIRQPSSLRSAIIDPFMDFLGRNGLQSALWILAFILCYKLGDSLATTLSSVFYKKMGYSNLDIGSIAKFASLIPSIIGSILGGIWMLKLGINRALWVFGFVQWISIFGFAWLAYLGPFDTITSFERLALAAVLIVEYFGVGLGTVAIISFMAKVTNPIYSAVQFALLSSIIAIPSKLWGSSVGWLVEQMGWTSFFMLCAALAIPGMLMLFKVAPWHAHD